MTRMLTYDLSKLNANRNEFQNTALHFNQKNHRSGKF